MEAFWKLGHKPINEEVKKLVDEWYDYFTKNSNGYINNSSVIDGLYQIMNESYKLGQESK